jgi:hypothetical protein
MLEGENCSISSLAYSLGPADIFSSQVDRTDTLIAVDIDINSACLHMPYRRIVWW